MTNVDKLNKVLLALGYRGGIEVRAHGITTSIQLPKALISDPIEGETSEEAARMALDRIAEHAQRKAREMRENSETIISVYGLVSSETVARELLDRATKDHDEIRDVLRPLDGESVLDCAKRRMAALAALVNEQATDSGETSIDTVSVSTELIKRLRRAYLLAWAECGTDRPLRDVQDNERVVAGVRAIISELATQSCELPTWETIRDAWLGFDASKAIGEYWSSAARVEKMLRSRRAPILAAKGMEIERLKAHGMALQSELDATKDRLQRTEQDLGNKRTRVTELEKLLHESEVKANARGLEIEGLRRLLADASQEPRKTLEMVRAKVSHLHAFNFDDRRMQENALRIVDEAIGANVEASASTARGEFDHCSIRPHYVNKSHEELLDSIVNLTNSVNSLTEQRDKMMQIPSPREALEALRVRVDALSTAPVKYAPGLDAPSLHKGAIMRFIDEELAKVTA